MKIQKILFLYLVFVCTCVEAAQNLTAEKFIVKSSYMEVKTGPGRSQPIFLVVEKNESFSIVKKKSDWLKVKTFKGVTGWVSLSTFYAAVELAGYDEKKTYLKSSGEIGFTAGKFGGDESYSINTGYYIKPEVLISVDLMKTSGSYSNSTISSIDLAIDFYRRLFLSPFISIGSGFMFNEPRETLVNAHSSKQSTYSYGAGININPYKNMNIRVSVRDFYLMDKKENYYDWRIGVYGAFF
ncbi:MAG: SH3 domain-containing protein [Gammaproteobacteria bacterium]|nr:SH3 domain-containing protein [Gammaproteobacteria bacterium]